MPKSGSPSSPGSSSSSSLPEEDSPEEETSENDEEAMDMDEFIAARNDIFRSAHGLLKDLGFENADVCDTLELAIFLAGDRIGGE